MNEVVKTVMNPPDDLPDTAVVAAGATLRAEPAGRCLGCCTWEEHSCDCAEIKQRRKLFNEAMIPSLYVEATIEGLDRDGQSSASLRRAIAWVQAWVESEDLPEQGILLAGPNGVGKSFLMAALARALTLERGIGCLFADFRDLLLRLKATFDGRGAEYEVYDSLLRPAVLIIDDVGSYRDSSWSRDVLQTIVARRHNACARTFLTTNLAINPRPDGPLGPFEKWVGPHCASRLAEMCFWLPVDGHDRRRRDRLQGHLLSPNG